MALINCKNCGKPVSDRAVRCPHCGADIKQGEPQPIDEKPTTGPTPPTTADANEADIAAKEQEAGTPPPTSGEADAESSPTSAQPRPEWNEFLSDEENLSLGARKPQSKPMLPVVTLAVVFVLLCCGVGFYYHRYQVHARKYERVKTERVEKERREEQVKGSAYRNFSTRDLKWADVKGYVHTIEYAKSLVPYGDVALGFSVKTLVFDKEGNLIDIKVQFQEDGKQYNVAIGRDGDGRIETLTYETYGYSRILEETGREYSSCKYKYDEGGRVKGVEFNADCYGLRGGVVGDYEETYSSFEEGKGYLARDMKYEDGICGYKETVRFTDFGYDEMGNWTSRNGRKEIAMEGDYYGTRNNASEDVEEVRRITYYAKDEIDFTKYLK